jgi:uncharacterized small protein (DUF1192 family)
MFDEEFKPRKKPDFEKRKLVDMSVDEIEKYIGELKEEIIRCEDDIKKKNATKAAAASFFKS